MGSASTTVGEVTGPMDATPAARTGGPATGVGVLVGVLAISATAWPPREMTLLPGTVPAGLLRTTALSALLAVVETGLKSASVPTTVPFTSLAGSGHTPSARPAGTSACNMSVLVPPEGPGTMEEAATAPPPAARITTAESTPVITPRLELRDPLSPRGDFSPRRGLSSPVVWSASGFASSLAFFWSSDTAVLLTEGNFIPRHTGA